MSDYYVGFFVVPASSLAQLHRVEEDALEAINAWVPERSWRLGLIFQRAAEVAVVSEIVEGSCTPITDNERNDAFCRTRHWLMQRILDDNPRAVLDPGQFDGLVRAFDRTSLDEFLAWDAEQGARRFHEVKPERLIELHEALDRALHARPPGSHGLVYTDFWEEDRHPPPPEPSEPEDTMSPADGARSAQMLQFRLRARINRQRRPWWAGAEHEEGRVLLGLVAPGRVDELARGYGRAIELLDQGEILAGVARLNEEVIPRVEEALLEPVIETMGGPVQALTLLRSKVEWDTYDHPRAVCSAEEAVELEGLLDEDTEDQVIEWIWEEERHWTRTEVRETYRKFRAVLTRAIERGHGFVWLHDNRRM